MARRRLTQSAARWLPWLIVTGGLLIVAFSVALDFLLPGANPDFGPNQVALALAGLVVVAIGIVLSRPRVQAQIGRITGRHLAIASGASVITLLALEAVLALAGFAPRYPQLLDVASIDVTVIPGFQNCDETGCHANLAEHQALCEEYPDDLDVARACHLNSNGFYDDDEFLATPSLTAVTPRVLMLGDSFTYGMTADLGRSWVEVVEAGLEDGEVWNTGLPGNGTGNVIAGLQAWGPVMQPDLAVYGFYMNDIDGSLYPLADRYVMLEIPDWGLPFDRVAVTQWFVNEEGVLEQLTMDQLLYRGLLGYEAPRNGIEAILGQTRLGTLLLRAIDVVRESVGQRWELAIAQTRANLLELQQTAAELDVPLLVLLIPSPVEAEVLSERYTVARSLLNELDIAYVDPRPLLEVNDYAYVGDPEDIHWNNSGHAIIGELMLACVQAISDGAPLSVCQEIAAQHVEQAGG